MTIVPFYLSGQTGPVFDFEKTSHNFGKINEVDGPVSYTFNFINTGKQPLVILDIETSCACTDPEWTKKPIPPGGKGIVKAIFDPKNKPGVAIKTLTIKSNTGSNKVLKFSVEVIPAPRTLKVIYPIKKGSLRFSYNQFPLTRIVKGATKDRTFRYANLTNEPLSLKLKDSPSNITATITPEKIEPNKEGQINISVSVDSNADAKYMSDKITLIIEPTGEEIDFVVSYKVK